MSALKWIRKASGLYESSVGDKVFQIERIDANDVTPSERSHWTNRSIWICRLNGVAFDTGDTLAEAKSYCHVED